VTCSAPGDVDVKKAGKTGTRQLGDNYGGLQKGNTSGHRSERTDRGYLFQHHNCTGEANKTFGNVRPPSAPTQKRPALGGRKRRRGRNQIKTTAIGSKKTSQGGG